MNRSLNAVIALVLLGVFLLAVNILANSTLYNARFDLTEDRLFTLSNGTVKTLEAIDEPITLRLFYSEDAANDILPLRTYAERVRDLLYEFQANAGGKLRLEIIDPEPFTDAEDRAVQFGLQSIQAPNGDPLYFGLVGTNMADGEEVIPFFFLDRENFLEYDLAKMVATLSRDEQPKIAILTSLPVDSGTGGIEAVMRGESHPFVVYQQLQELFDVTLLKPDDVVIGEEYDLLLVAHPDELGEAMLYGIDQYVLGGGRAVVFVDPNSEVSIVTPAERREQRFPREPGPESSTLPGILEAWGVGFDTEKMVVDRALARRVMLGSRDRQQTIPYVAWLSVTPEHMSGADPSTADLQVLNMASAGAFVPLEGATTTFTPLMTTSEQSSLVNLTPRIRQAPDPTELLRSFEASDGRYVLSARISGPVSTAFPDGPPAPEEADPEEEASTDPPEWPAHRTASDGDINVIVVADSDMLDDTHWIQSGRFRGELVYVPVADNGSFVVNAVENMAGSGNLIGLRSRAPATRPFEVVENIRRDAESQFLAEEKRLQDRLESIQRRVEEMQRGIGDGTAEGLVSEQQADEIRRAREEIVSTRAALRDVQRNLRKDVENLETLLKFLNIGAVPVLVALFALVLAAFRYRRRKRQAQIFRTLGATS